MSALRDNKPPCSDEAFVVAWNTAGTIQEACYLAGYRSKAKSAASSAARRAAKLRKLGVPMKRFRRGPRLTSCVKKLKLFAKRALQESLGEGT